MTHTLHRYGKVDTLNDDLVFLSMSAKGFANEEGSGEKMKRTLEIAQKHNPVNIGDMKTGNILATSEDEILKNVVDTSIVHAVFTNIEDAAAFAKEVKEAELGISLVVSGPFDRTWEVADKAGCTGHTIEFSGGIWGKTDKLPAPEVLEFTTMCGHGMISRYLVEDVIKRVKTGKMSAKEGSVEIGKQCCCGIYNPDRSEKLLEALAAKK
ncbi:MAG: hypothetical protein HQ588_03995 [Deltaproteobacteria bacterium]|nr:hypothetical protein [Deltaproteobacteria bacterium]